MMMMMMMMMMTGGCAPVGSDSAKANKNKVSPERVGRARGHGHLPQVPRGVGG